MNISSIRPFSAVSSLKSLSMPINQVNNDKGYEKNDSLVSFKGQDLVSNSIKSSIDEMLKYPKDIKYRKELMKNAGLNPREFYKIRSIIGSQEIMSIMKNFNNDEGPYSAGKDYENVLSCNMRANLHIHTVASDGAMTPEELLEKASSYADRVAKNNPDAKDAPFVIAITDHDTTESTKEVIKLISKNPEKYKNLRVVLGVEMTTYNNIALDIIKEPLNTHVLVYGIDPNEPTFDAFISSTKDKKFDIQSKMIDKANELYGEEYGTKGIFSVKQAKEYFPPLNKGLLGVYNYISAYLDTKNNLENVVLKDDKLKQLLVENDLPTTSDELLTDMKEFYYPLTYNNKALKLKDALPKYLSKKTDVDEETIKNMYSDALNSSSKSFNDKLKDGLEEYKRTVVPKYDYVPDFKGLYDALRDQEGAIIGLAHPLESIKKIKNPEDRFIFLEDFYNQFKDNCKEKAVFSEVYYQSYPTETRSFQIDTRTVDFFNELSEKHDLFKTGSQDTHRTNIFKRYY